MKIRVLRVIRGLDDRDTSLSAAWIDRDHVVAIRG
jgi:hypothetical protein